MFALYHSYIVILLALLHKFYAEEQNNYPYWKEEYSF